MWPLNVDPNEMGNNCINPYSGTLDQRDQNYVLAQQTVNIWALSEKRRQDAISNIPNMSDRELLEAIYKMLLR